MLAELAACNAAFSVIKTALANSGEIANAGKALGTYFNQKNALEKKLREEAKYPKGTKLLSEDERFETLNNLELKKKQLENELFSLPIAVKTMLMRNRQAEIENKLNDIDSAINQFSRKMVFIKAD